MMEIRVVVNGDEYTEDRFKKDGREVSNVYFFKQKKWICKSR